MLQLHSSRMFVLSAHFNQLILILLTQMSHTNSHEIVIDVLREPFLHQQRAFHVLAAALMKEAEINPDKK